MGYIASDSKPPLTTARFARYGVFERVDGRADRLEVGVLNADIGTRNARAEVVEHQDGAFSLTCR